MSQERNLDLVQVTEKIIPPVCKILEYGKYLYQLKKKSGKQSKSKGGETKGIRIRFNTSEHDLETKARQAHKFLEQGNKIKTELMLKGREKALRGHAKEKMNKFLEILKTYGPIELDEPVNRRQFNTITVIIKRGKKHEENESKNSKIVS